MSKCVRCADEARAGSNYCAGHWEQLMTKWHGVRCSFCDRRVRRRYGLDLLGRVYCQRWSCKLSLAFKRWLRQLAVRVQRFARDA